MAFWTHLEPCKHEWFCGHRDLNSNFVYSGYLAEFCHCVHSFCQPDWHFRLSASTSECSNSSPPAAAEGQELKALQSHSSAHPGHGAGVPQSSWAPPEHGQGSVGIHTSHTCRAPTPRAGWGLWVAPQPVGGNIRSHNAALRWAFGLGPCFCCKNEVKIMV